MFPFDMDEDDERALTTDTESEEEKEPAPEYEIDFDTMTLTGRLITGIDAVKQWVRICLEIPRYEHTQYSWAYGQEFESLIGKGYTEAEIRPIIQRMIEEALSQNEDITSVGDFDIKKNGDRVTAAFRIETIYGETNQEVVVNV